MHQTINVRYSSWAKVSCYSKTQNRCGLFSFFEEFLLLLLLHRISQNLSLLSFLYQLH
jgi:hypothetical protein